MRGYQFTVVRPALAKRAKLLHWFRKGPKDLKDFETKVKESVGRYRHEPERQENSVSRA